MFSKQYNQLQRHEKLPSVKREMTVHNNGMESNDKRTALKLDEFKNLVNLRHGVHEAYPRIKLYWGRWDSVGLYFIPTGIVMRTTNPIHPKPFHPTPRTSFWDISYDSKWLRSDANPTDLYRDGYSYAIFGMMQQPRLLRWALR